MRLTVPEPDCGRGVDTVIMTELQRAADAHGDTVIYILRAEPGQDVRRVMKRALITFGSV